MKSRTWSALSVAMLSLSLSACAGDADPAAPASTAPASETSAPADTASAPAPVGGEGTYELGADDGGYSTITFYAPQDATYLAEVEAFRQKAGAPEVTYASVLIDNTNGASELAPGDFSVVSTDGSTTGFTNITNAIGDWYLDAPTGADYYNDGVTLSNSLLTTGSALPGATSEALYVSSTKPADISRVFGSDAFGEAVEAVKAS